MTAAGRLVFVFSPRQSGPHKRKRDSDTEERAGRRRGRADRAQRRRAEVDELEADAAVPSKRRKCWFGAKCRRQHTTCRYAHPQQPATATATTTTTTPSPSQSTTATSDVNATQPLAPATVVAATAVVTATTTATTTEAAPQPVQQTPAKAAAPAAAAVTKSAAKSTKAALAAQQQQQQQPAAPPIEVSDMQVSKLLRRLPADHVPRTTGRRRDSRPRGRCATPGWNASRSRRCSCCATSPHSITTCGSPPPLGSRSTCRSTCRSRRPSSSRQRRSSSRSARH